MSARHTSAPWSFSKRGQRVYGGITNNVMIAQVGINPEWQANARLIAAAPELLEALKWACDAIHEHAPGLEHLADNWERLIALATGDSNA